MSGLLDQILLEDIARNCPQELMAFHRCVGARNSGCDNEQVGLSLCIKLKVPAFHRIQAQCSGKLQAYEACLRTSGGKQDRCKHDLESLRQCATNSIS